LIKYVAKIFDQVNYYLRTLSNVAYQTVSCISTSSKKRN